MFVQFLSVSYVRIYIYMYVLYVFSRYLLGRAGYWSSESPPGSRSNETVVFAEHRVLLTGLFFSLTEFDLFRRRCDSCPTTLELAREQRTPLGAHQFTKSSSPAKFLERCEKSVGLAGQG